MPDPIDLSRAEVEHVALLGRLSLTDEEIVRYTGQLNRILAYFSELNEADTSAISGTTHVVPMLNVTRPDERRPGLPTEDALANAPDSEDVYFRVPRVI